MPPAPALAPPNIRDDLGDLADIAVAVNRPEIADELSRIRGSLSRGELTIVVLGQFKRGKSSLLNAFAGRRAFPAGVVPLTAVATHLIRGAEGARVVDDVGNVRSVPITALDEFVSEQRNPGNARGVARVEVSLPLPAWTDGITFVDSPGIGSPHDENTRAARAVLPHADAAIFVLSPDPSITADELAFLSEAAAHASKFFFVLNKSDLASPTERAELERYLSGVLHDRCGFGEIRLHAVSSKLALEGAERHDLRARTESGMDQLWAEIRRFVGTDRSESVRRVGALRSRQFAERLRSSIDLAVRATEMSDAELAAHVSALRTGIEVVRGEMRATVAVLELDIALMARRMEEEPRTRLSRLTPGLSATLDKGLSERPGSTSGEVVRRFEANLQANIDTEVGPIRAALREEAEKGLARIAAEFATRIRRWLADLATLVHREFGVALPEFGVPVSVVAPDRYSDRVERLLEGTMAGQATLLLPPAVLRRRLRSRLPRLVADELDAQAGRLRADLIERIGRTWERMRSQAVADLESDLRLLESAASDGEHRRRTDAQETAAWRQAQGALRARLVEIEERAVTASRAG